MEIFDSHTHLNDDAFAGQAKEYIAQAKKLDVTQMAIVGSDEKLNQKALELAQNYDELFAIIGWHPESARDFDDAAKQHLIEQLKEPKVVAVGEIGLDYHWDTSYNDIQKEVFKQQIQIAKDVDLPISIHTRDAFEDTYQILKEVGLPDSGAIMHSFNGDPKWMEKFLDLGAMISFSGVVSFKNAPDVHASAKVVPLDRMLVETDAPYLTPEPHRGEQNQPGYTRYVVEAIAKLRDVSVSDIAEATFNNAHRIFRIKHN